MIILKLRVALDIDSTTCDTSRAILEALNKEHSTKFCMNDISCWNPTLSDGSKTLSWEKELFKKFDTPGFLRSVPVIAGATEVVDKLRKDRDVFFITSRNCKYADETLGWVDDNFQGLDVVFATDGKHKYIDLFDILLDDSPREILSVYMGGGRPVIFDGPYNKELPSEIPRVHSWHQFYDHVIDIENIP